MGIKGIIFDMDNTLLRSNIHFEAMKMEIFQFLSSRKFIFSELDLKKHTSSTIIEQALSTRLMSPDEIQNMWNIAKKHEVAGMHQAKLESGVRELLESLKHNYYLTIVTNNSEEAAEQALQDNGIREYFDHVVGRERMASLKPSPDGFRHVLQLYPDTLPGDWISVGDSWIDGRASGQADIPFISYRADILKMNVREVFPSGQIQDIREIRRFL